MKNRLPLVFILITLMLDSRGFGLIVPVMPNLIQELETWGKPHSGGDFASSYAVYMWASYWRTI